jgi:hypothetical protein
MRGEPIGRLWSVDGFGVGGGGIPEGEPSRKERSSEADGGGCVMNETDEGCGDRVDVQAISGKRTWRDSGVKERERGVWRDKVREKSRFRGTIIEVVVGNRCGSG